MCLLYAMKKINNHNNKNENASYICYFLEKKKQITDVSVLIVSVSTNPLIACPSSCHAAFAVL